MAQLLEEIIKLLDTAKSNFKCDCRTDAGIMIYPTHQLETDWALVCGSNLGLSGRPMNASIGPLVAGRNKPKDQVAMSVQQSWINFRDEHSKYLTTQCKTLSRPLYSRIWEPHGSGLLRPMSSRLQKSEGMCLGCFMGSLGMDNADSLLHLKACTLRSVKE